MDVLVAGDGDGKGGRSSKRKSTETTARAPKKVKKGLTVPNSGPKRRTVAPSDDEEDEFDGFELATDGDNDGREEEGEEEDYPVYGEDDGAMSSYGRRGALDSDGPIDENGWSAIVKGDRPSKGPKDKRAVEVLELE